MMRCCCRESSNASHSRVTPRIPRAVDSGWFAVDSERNSTINPSAAKINVGIQIVGEMNSILRTATCPNQILKNAVSAATTPMKFIMRLPHFDFARSRYGQKNPDLLDHRLRSARVEEKNIRAPYQRQPSHCP